MQYARSSSLLPSEDKWRLLPRAREHFLKADRLLDVYRTRSDGIDLPRLAQTIMEDRVSEAVGISRLTRRVLVLAAMIELRKQQARWAPGSSEALERVERDLMGWKERWSGLSEDDNEIHFSFHGVLLRYCDPSHWPPELIADCASADTRRAIRHARLRGAEVIRKYIRKWEGGWKRVFFWVDTPRDDTGIGWLRKAAELGNAVAQRELAQCYARGKEVRGNDSLAAIWYRRAAEQGDQVAQHLFGYCCNHGRGVPQDHVEAAKWYRASAEAGDAPAQYNLGLSYYYGSGVKQDYAEAVKWLRKAAEQGLAEAQGNLGLCYFEGQGVPQDYSQAVENFRKAADQGYAEAQYNLSTCYCAGLGVSRDYVEAYKWLDLIPMSKLFGRLECARKLRDEIAAGMTPEEIAEARRRVASFRVRNR